MSHSSGIDLSDDLINQFKQIDRTGEGRFIKASINDDSVIVDQTEPGTDNFDADLDLVLPLLQPTDPCFILFRMDVDKVRQKMLYSSTKSRFKQTLGSISFQSEIHGTTANDFGSAGYAAYLAHEASPNPLTEQEEEREREIELGVAAFGAAPTGMATVTASNGVAFPMDDAVVTAVTELVENGNNYVQIGIEIDDERIILQETKNIAFEEISTCVPLEFPAFHFFRWDHTFEGQDQTSYIYIFSCPDGSGETKSAPVKHRMLYSTSKSVVEQVLTQNNVEIALKLEVNAPRDLVPEDIEKQIHPPPVEKKKMFAKPKPKYQRKK
ncbi:Twinfilin [Entamoeba marina]